MKRRGLTLLELVVVLVILVALATLIVPSIGFLGRGSQDVATRENLLRLQELLANRYMVDMGELPRPAPAAVAAGTRQDHPQLRYLFINPDAEAAVPTAGGTWLTTRRWQGPYLRHDGVTYQIWAIKNFTNAYGLGDVLDDSGRVATLGNPRDPTVSDAWGRPIVIQVPNTSGGAAPTADDMTFARLVSAGADGVINTPETGADAQLVRMPDKATRGDDILIYLFRNDEYGDGVPKLGQ